MDKEKRKALKFEAKRERFLDLLGKVKVIDMHPRDIMVETIKFKFENGLKEKDHEQLAVRIRGAMFAYIRHELTVNYNEALKLLNYNPDRDELYPMLKAKTDKLIDRKYANIRTKRKEALELIKKYGG